MKIPFKKVQTVLLVMLLLFVGAGLYAATTMTLKATDTPEFCASCHVMHEVVRTQQHSVHASLACNDCHLPDKGMKRLYHKAKSGAWDFYQNTLGDPPDVIHASLEMKEIINQNCNSCHVMTNLNVTSMDSKKFCTDCHRQVPHYSKSPIAERMAANE
ncbi:NapC/NirT family cytochrome c [Desulfococcaceae bacterium OttesenSCG-928-F15]|nr:NapC/NirT family cytochrome c [Desulfococcaceae bacterium OttesenSCG-928-F15]